jgi:hypothetical protein
MTTSTAPMTKTALIKHIKERQGKDKAAIFSLPLGEIKIYPGFNHRIDYDLQPLVDFIKANGVKFPPIKLQLIDGELYVDEGHRRTMASIEAGMDLNTTRLDCYVDLTDNSERSQAERIANQVSSNNGKKYSNIELMLVCRDLKEKYKWESVDIYTRLGISQPLYSNLSKMFGLSKKLLLAIEESKIKYTEILDALRSGASEDDIFTHIHDTVAYQKSLLEPEVVDSDDEVTNIVKYEGGESIGDYEELNSDDTTNIEGRYEQMVRTEPNKEPKPKKVAKPAPKWKKPDYKLMCHNIVNLYEIDQKDDMVTISIPVEDWQTIMADVEKGYKSK